MLNFVEVMNFESKSVGLVLIVALAITTAPMSGWAEVENGGVTGEPTAGCHMHGGGSLPAQPLSPPTSYRCCLTGHDTAIVRTVFIAQPSVEMLDLVVTNTPALNLSNWCELQVSAVLLNDPPGLTPLRV